MINGTGWEEGVVRGWSRGIAHMERDKTHACVKNRARVFCRVLYAVLWNILCPCTFSI